MADNITLNTMSGGPAVVSEEVATNTQIAVCKLHTGALHADGGPVTTSNPLPVGLQGSITVGAGTAVIGHTITDAGSVADVTDRAGRLLGHVVVDSGSVAVTGTFWQTTQPVSAASLPLPALASTSALQTTANTSLASLDAKVPALGQALAAASLPVVLPAAIVTALTPPAAITGFATEITLAGLSAAVATSANQAAIATLTGAVTETAPATDTASSGLNGRLQRLAQRLSSLIALLPTALGGAGGLKTELVSALPAGSNLLGMAIAPQQTGALYSGTTALTPKFTSIAASASGDNTVVAAVAGKKIRVLKFTAIAAGAVNAKFSDGPAGTALTGTMTIAGAGGGLSGSYSPLGNFETSAGNALVLNLSGAVAVAGYLTYCEA